MERARVNSLIFRVGAKPLLTADGPGNTTAPDEDLVAELAALGLTCLGDVRGIRCRLFHARQRFGFAGNNIAN